MLTDWDRRLHKQRGMHRLGECNNLLGRYKRLKQASRELLAKLEELLSTMEKWTQSSQTQADVQVFILDQLYAALPRAPFTDDDTQRIAARVYEYIWQRSAAGALFGEAA